MVPALALLAIGMVVLMAGCQEPVFLPEGDGQAGREVFVRQGCNYCHEVAGEDFEPSIEPPVPFRLADPRSPKSRQYLAESIIAPSHRFAKPPHVPIVTDPPVMADRPEYKGIRREDGKSRMINFTEVLLVQEWLDLVTYLDEQQQKAAH
ncbi:MAG TPA: hypothetical protein VLV83_13790 [Acidobacteriota bacterium]|nr:hypothetical protein [Acidobacteriota bacterium]